MTILKLLTLIVLYVFIGTIVSKIGEKISNGKNFAWKKDPDEVVFMTFGWPLFLLIFAIFYTGKGIMKIINPIADKSIDGVCKIINNKKECDK